MVHLDDAVISICDKITPALERASYQKGSCNLIRWIFDLPEVFDAEKGQSVYTCAIGDFRSSQKSGPCNRILPNPKLLSSLPIYSLD